MTGIASRRLFVAGVFVLLVGGGLMVYADPVGAQSPGVTQPKPAEPATMREYAKVVRTLPFSNTDDFYDASRNFIVTRDNAVSYSASGKVVWSLQDYGFLLQGTPPPPTVNPSLWRQAVINMNNGLYKVAEHIYQVRGFDVTNLMIIEGDTGIILIDPMDAKETAATALALYQSHRDPGKARKVKAVIFTHSHMDHYGGVKGVVTEDDYNAGKFKVIAPEGFLEAAISENLFAGNVMGRRSQYSYGTYLPKGPRGQVDVGIGKARPVNAAMTMLAPTDDVTTDLQEMWVDGVRMQFLLAPETEAPAEMLIWFPQFKALCAAEDMNHTNHNFYTLRGATIRNGKTWWKVVQTAIEEFGDAQVMFFAHTWPVWGTEDIIDMMTKQRDLYKYVHDQSLHLANQGYTMTEVAERLKLPASLSQQWFNRDYYGTVNHNAKAVYQRYLGWFDSNPSNLHPLPPRAAAVRYVEYMGGAEAVITRARKAFKDGDYRWVAQVMNHVVFAEPHNRAARELQADAFEQMGYQSESGIWRNHYLVGAMELRGGVPGKDVQTPSDASDQFRSITLDLYFDYLGILLDGPRADGKRIVLNWNVYYADKSADVYVTTLENSALTYRGPHRQAPYPDATLKMTRDTLDAINTGQTTWAEAIKSKAVDVDNPKPLQDLLSLLGTFDLMFNIVTP